MNINMVYRNKRKKHKRKGKPRDINEAIEYTKQ